jgi:hypothetical protein
VQKKFQIFVVDLAVFVVAYMLLKYFTKNISKATSFITVSNLPPETIYQGQPQYVLMQTVL